MRLDERPRARDTRQASAHCPPRSVSDVPTLCRVGLLDAAVAVLAAAALELLVFLWGDDRVLADVRDVAFACARA